MNRRRVRRAWDSARALLVTASGRRLGDAAAESAFFVALAVLPTMLTTSAVLRALQPVLGGDVGRQVEDGLARLLRIVLSSRGGVAADAAQSLLTRDNGGLLTLGTIASLLVMTRAMRSVLTGLHAVSGPADASRTYSGRQLWTLAAGLAVLSVALAAVTLAMLAVGPLLGHARDLAPGSDRVVAVVWVVLRWPVGVIALVALVSLVHSVGLRRPHGPRNRRRSRRAAVLGALVSAAGMIAASAVLPVYIHLASGVSPTLGALGGGLILLVWSYLLMLSLLIGAQVRVRARRAPERRPTSATALTGAAAGRASAGDDQRPGERRGADHAGVVAEGGHDDAQLR